MYKSKFLNKVYLVMICLSILFSFASCVSQPALQTTVYGLVDVGEVMNTIASPQMRGRLAGTPENAEAAAYIHSIFEKLGLTPVFGSNFYHAYQQEVFNPNLSNPQLTITLADGSRQSLQFGSEFMFHVPSGPVSLRIIPAADETWQDAQTGAAFLVGHRLSMRAPRSGIIEAGRVVPNPIFATPVAPLSIFF